MDSQNIYKWKKSVDNFDENRVVVTSLRESMCVVNIEIYKLAYTISLNSELKKKKRKKS